METEESTDRLLAAYEGTAAAKDFTLAADAMMPSEKKGWAAEYFKLAEPPPQGATKVRFTKVEVRLKSYAMSTTDPTVGIHAATADVPPKPGAAIGSTARLSRAGLSSAYKVVSAALPAGIFATDFAAAFYIVLKGGGMTPSAYTEYQLTGTDDVPHMEWSTDGGATWQPAQANWNAQDLWFRVYGRYTIASP